MKKIIIVLSAFCILHSAFALDWNYSTNLFPSLTTPTNIFCGTNFTDPARDSYITIWNKLNNDINLMWGRIAAGSGGGSFYPSNTWTLAGITNAMHSGDIITLNSNGQKLVDVWMSNTTPILKPHW